MDTLSTEIVLLIAGHLCSVTKSTQYLLHMRSVNRTFNEAILHVLFIGAPKRPSPYRFQEAACEMRSEKCMDCPCTDVGTYSQRASTYACLYLQGHLAIGRSADSRKQILFQRLREAATVLERICGTQPWEKFFGRVGRPAVLSSNPVFSDAYRHMICKAALFHLGNAFILEEKRTLGPSDIESEDPRFWVINAACYLGSSAILDCVLGMSAEGNHEAQPFDAMQALSRCIPIAIERGHRQLALAAYERGVSVHCAEGLKQPCPWRAVVRVADVDTAMVLLKSCSDASRHTKITSALGEHMGEPKDLQRYFQVFQLLWPLTDHSQRMRQSNIAVAAARIGSCEALTYLRGRGALSAAHLSIPQSNSALIGPARTGNLACLRALLENRYFEGVSHGQINNAVSCAAGISLQMNNLHVYVELSQRFEKVFTRAGWFARLAAADNTLTMMQARLEKDPGLLTSDASPYQLSSSQRTIGQAALEYALRSLRHENIEWLLDLDIRLHGDSEAYLVDWSYHQMRKDRFNATQAVLRKFDVRLLEVVV